MLEPRNFMAWHTGKTKDITKYGNPHAIGVEVHYTPGEGLWTGEMWDALTYLARQYINLEKVTHREIAIPKGRKIDPSGVTDVAFTYWKNSYHRPYTIYSANVRANIREKPTRNSKIVGTINAGSTVYGINGDIVSGEVINGIDRWRYVNYMGYVYEPLITSIKSVE